MRRWYVSLALLSILVVGCEESEQEEAAIRMAQFARGIIDSNAADLEPLSATGGPLNTMCQPGYEPPWNCSISCQSNGTIFTSASITCNQFADTESGLPESRCDGEWQVGQSDQNLLTFNFDPVNLILKIIWKISGDIYFWPGWRDKLWVGGNLTFRWDGSQVDFNCESETTVMPDMATVQNCQAFQDLVNEPCN